MASLSRSVPSFAVAGAYTSRFYLSIALTGLVALSVWRGHLGVGIFILVLCSYLFCGGIILKTAWQELWQGLFGFALFSAVGITGGFLYSAWQTFAAGAVFAPIPSLYVETAFYIVLCLWFLRRHALRRQHTHALMQKLDGFLPKSARVLVGGKMEIKFATELTPGDLIVVKPGERLPADGILKKGQTTIDESLITGNRLPISKIEGATLYAGTLNKTSEIYVEVTQLLAQSAFAGIIQSIKQSHFVRGGNLKTANRAARQTLLAGVVLAALIYGFYLYRYGSALWAYYFGAVLFTLGLMPVGFFFAGVLARVCVRAGAARKGIDLQCMEALPLLAEADVFFIDKTGTLTYGDLRVCTLHPTIGHTAKELLLCALTAEQMVDGPFAQAIRLRAKQDGLTPPEVLHVDVLPGLGVRAKSRGDLILCGQVKWLLEQGVPAQVQEVSTPSGALVCVAKNGEYLGHIALSDALRPGAKELVDFLHAQGKELLLISGDNESSVTSIAAQVGIKQRTFNVLPQTKAQIILNWQALGKKVVMVGDGFNDIVALLRANAGVVFASGRNVYNEWVDVRLRRQDLFCLIDLFTINKKCVRAQRGNAQLSVCLNALVLLGLLYGGKSLPWYAVLLAQGACVVAVFINSARYMK